MSKVTMEKTYSLKQEKYFLHKSSSTPLCYEIYSDSLHTHHTGMSNNQISLQMSILFDFVNTLQQHQAPIVNIAVSLRVLGEAKGAPL